jgi:hypothetical protein
MLRSRGTRALALVLALALGVSALALLLRGSSLPRAQAPLESLEVADSTAPVRGVLVGAGDIARCRSRADDSTGGLLRELVAIYQRRRIPVVVFTAGDNAYPGGTPRDFRNCYDPAWGGPLKGITRPAPGNHDYRLEDGTGYYAYFGEAAGEPDRGYYEYGLAGWDIFSLNSEVFQPALHQLGQVHDSLAAAQLAWLQERLKGATGDCSIAYWHHPRWDSGPHWNNRHLDTLWRLLYSAGAEIVINGHDHLYERFKPLRPDSTVDEAQGIVEFVVGTGGGVLRRFPGGRNPGISAKQIEWRYGVLVLELQPDRAHYRFLAASGETLDEGDLPCHGRPGNRGP